MPNPNLGGQFEHARVPPSLYSYGKPRSDATNAPATVYSKSSPTAPAHRATNPTQFTEYSIETPTDPPTSHAKHMLEM